VVKIFKKFEFLVRNSLLSFSEETANRYVQNFMNTKSQWINIFKNISELPPIETYLISSSATDKEILTREKINISGKEIN
jgi:hypothetical protein